MPIREYLCLHCAKLTEKLSQFATEDVKCPRCGAPTVRVPSAHAKTAKNWEVK